MIAMLQRLYERTIRLLRLSERYTKTDMVYLAASAWWMNLSTLFVSLLSLILYIVFSHVVSKETFGMYQYLLSISVIVGSLTLTGMNSAVTRAVARGFEGTLRLSVAAQLRWMVLPFLLAASIAAYYAIQGNAVLAFGSLIIGVLIPISNTFNTYTAFLQGKMDFRSLFFYGLGTNTVYFGALVASVLLFPFVALAFLAVNIISQAGMNALLYYRTLARFRPNDSVDKESIEYGKHLSAMGLIGAVASQVDAILAFHYLGAAQLATYGFATAIPDRLAGLFKFIPAAALPKLSVKEPGTIRSVLNVRIWFAVIAAGALALLYAECAPLVFSLLFPAYTPSVPFSQVYAITIITSLTGIYMQGLIAQRAVSRLYLYSVVSPILQIILQVVGILSWGLWGLVIAKVASSVLTSILVLVLLMLHKPKEDKRQQS